ncbi:hypothetical protein APHAL10511_002515 [Amanita phalloides]|nr:hypothetical protein APHAL10511_002515 [Amanita phalloides]
MAENHPLLNAGASVKSWALPPANPMQSDRLYNVTQLISPPPEETLRRSVVPFTPSLLASTAQSSSKRKRRGQPTVSLHQELTPSPKPRKHAKQVTDPESPTRSTFAMSTTPIKSKQAVVISPYAHTLSTENTVILKTKLTRSRRGATPIPPYEPPSVVFTSPREVMAVSPPSKSSARKSKPKAHAKSSSIKIVPVKKEMPNIDLNAPIPPPSPTDDPILLSGPFGPSTSTPPRPHSVTEAGEIPIAGRNPFHDSDDLDYYDWRPNTRPDNFNSSDSLSIMGFRPSDADVAPVELPVFHLDDLPPSSDAWSDSDDDFLDGLEARQETIDEGEGQYTGRWRTLLVKTKQDPPSSVTRARMEHWGRPVSPFPEEAKSLDLLDEEEEEQVQDGLGLDELEENADQDQDAIDEEEVRRISVEPEDEYYVPSQAAELRTETSCNVSAAVLTDAINGRNCAPNSSVEIADSIFAPDTMQTARIGRVEPGVVPMNDLLLDGASDDDSDDETELSFVKITSADPRAAARAAAILKQHDYDCFTEITNSKRRRSAPDRMLRRGTTVAEALARKSIAEGRITKGKPKKRSSIVGTGVIGSQVFISGAPVTTLRNLLEEVESEVSFIGTPTKGGREPPLSRRLSLGVFGLSFIDCLTNREGESEWTKDDWKLLDACFTDERLVLGRRLQLEGDGLVDVDAINIDCVVDRYIGILGGENSVKRLGMDWERDVIVQRAKALRKKQRSGSAAPPTTPMSSTVIKTADVDIPDFTPLPARTLFQRILRPALPPPIIGDALFQDLGEDDMDQTKLPTPLLAPRYAHLLKEAPAVSNECISHINQTTPSGEESVLGEPSCVENCHPPTTPATFGARVKGFLSSYLPTLSRTAPGPSRKILNTVQPRLPLPPPDLLEKPRGPITTPTRPSLPKPKHPKELVRLHPAPLPKVSLIPRLKPRRLVQLNPVPPPKTREPIPVLKPRNSNGSVKDLVQSFEELNEGERK